MRIYYKVTGIPGLPIDGDNRPNWIRFPECPQCQRAFGVALRYPNFVPSRDGSKRVKQLFRILRTLDAPNFWEAFKEFRERMAKEAPDASFTPPGTEFGVLRLSVDEPVEMCSPNTGALIIKTSLFDRLTSSGLKLRACPTVLSPAKVGKIEGYVELLALPKLHKSPAYPGQLCNMCLRFDPAWDEASLPVRLKDIPKDEDLFRVYERPTVLLATDRFVQAVADFFAPNVAWRLVEITD